MSAGTSRDDRAFERPKVTVRSIREMKARGERIVSVTAYDYPTARLADEAGVDLILVGDSLGMVVLGYESTIPVTMAEMSHHLKAVMRAQPRALVIADLPFASFQAGPEDAVHNSARFVKRGAEGVKLEGGRRVLPQIEAILAADIPVLGHLGLTPQSVHAFGGYRVQARGADAAEALLEDARALERAGVFAIVLEGIPRELGADVSRALTIPTIGIGAGAECDGQVLVIHDLVGLSFGKPARFVRPYAQVGDAIRGAVASFRDDVRAGRYPSPEETYAAGPDPAKAAVPGTAPATAAAPASKTPEKPACKS
ncbi:MAG TPA: 3-methyl-2-oxobutanoate hydroxymethyltransferase [Candidatus Eisenbacteria bacterium]|nr:3-methyl-2-oxobutanoate hydroxymethyltransferase [Candidatus Eisenbacteria bacterium]